MSDYLIEIRVGDNAQVAIHSNFKQTLTKLVLEPVGHVTLIANIQSSNPV